MKIVLEDKVYVQLNDIMYLIHNLDGVAIPAGLLEIVFKNGEPFCCTDDNRYDFIEFRDKQSIEFFKGFDYSVDYLFFKDMSVEEVIDIGKSLSDERNNLAKKFNEMSNEDKEKNISIISECELLDFKLESLRDIVWMKKGYLKIKLPKIDQINGGKSKGLDKIKKLFKKR